MIKTLNLTANAETSISGLGGDRCRIQNRTSGTLYVSDKPGIAPCADGVMSIPSGRGDYFPYSMVSDTVYLLSESGGNVEISGEHYYRPFDSAAETGGKAVGNPVVMDDLQGGVPFPEITVSGDISGKELSLNVCGKNLIPYPYRDTTKTLNGITFTDNGDGTITANGTATEEAVFYFNTMNLSVGTYFLSGCPVGGSHTNYRMQLADNTWETWFIDLGDGTEVTLNKKVSLTQFRIYIAKGATVNNIVFKPQLELGIAATDYEPYSGAEYKLTPDSNPYTVPANIRQLEGRNVLYIADSSAQLAVMGAVLDKAAEKVWEEFDKLDDTAYTGDAKTLGGKNASDFASADDAYWLYTYAANGHKHGETNRIKAVYNVKNDSRFYLQDENGYGVRVSMADDAGTVQGYTAADFLTRAPAVGMGTTTGTSASAVTLGYQPSILLVTSRQKTGNSVLLHQEHTSGEISLSSADGTVSAAVTVTLTDTGFEVSAPGQDTAFSFDYMVFK